MPVRCCQQGDSYEQNLWLLRLRRLKASIPYSKHLMIDFYLIFLRGLRAQLLKLRKFEDWFPNSLTSVRKVLTLRV